MSGAGLRPHRHQLNRDRHLFWGWRMKQCRQSKNQNHAQDQVQRRRQHQATPPDAVGQRKGRFQLG
jgi:hypothetical protein